MHMLYYVVVEDLNNLDRVLEPYYETDDIFSPYVSFHTVLDDNYNEIAYLRKCNEIALTDNLNFINNKKEKENDNGLVKFAKKNSMSFKKYIEDKFYSYKKDKDKVLYGYYYNENALYDYYDIGGRWHNLLLINQEEEDLADIGTTVFAKENNCYDDVFLKDNNVISTNYAKISDIRFDLIDKFFNKNNNNTFTPSGLIIEGEDPYTIYKNQEEYNFSKKYVKGPSLINQEEFWEKINKNKDKYLFVIDMHI